MCNEKRALEGLVAAAVFVTLKQLPVCFNISGMPRMRFLVYLIVFSITIQNTCPYGWAGKTALISPQVAPCQHCPIKEDRRPAESDARKDFKKDLSYINHLFVILTSTPDTAFQILSPIDRAPHIKSGQFRDVHLDPLLRPPVLDSPL